LHNRQLRSERKLGRLYVRLGGFAYQVIIHIGRLPLNLAYIGVQRRKAIMRLFRREVEGGFTLIDWHGGFVGINKTGKNWRHVDAWYESCPCCKGAFDLAIELFGYELAAYNDGGPCELEAFFEDFEKNAIPKQPYTKPQISRRRLPYQRKRIAHVTR
jgi:hypothetical protein